jgi:hypothetical protein
MDQISADLSAEFECMFAAQIRNLVNEIVDFVWPDKLGEIVEGAQLRKWADSYVRYALQQRIGKASVDVVGKIEVVRKNLKNVVRESASKFVGPR